MGRKAFCSAQLQTTLRMSLVIGGQYTGPPAMLVSECSPAPGGMRATDEGRPSGA